LQRLLATYETQIGYATSIEFRLCEWRKTGYALGANLDRRRLADQPSDGPTSTKIR